MERDDYTQFVLPGGGQRLTFSLLASACCALSLWSLVAWSLSLRFNGAAIPSASKMAMQVTSRKKLLYNQIESWVVSIRETPTHNQVRPYQITAYLYPQLHCS